MSEVESNNVPMPESESNPARPTDHSQAGLVVAILWALLSIIFAIVLLVNAKDQAYGGDAYTGIQNAVMWAVRGIAFLLVGSGAVGMIIAIRRDRN